MDKVAILVDGGYYKVCFRQKYKANPKADNVIEHCNKLMKHCFSANKELFRIFYYDCLPYDKADEHPITKQVIEYNSTPQYEENMAFLNELKIKPSIAFRKGLLHLNGWKLTSNALANLIHSKREIKPHDIQADFKQKRIDMKIGLDIASLSTKRNVDTIILVTGDTDFIPAMKFARREGVKVFINILKPDCSEDLKEHADDVVKLKPLV
ncbi:MAG: hypothetical protein A2Y40_05100 [Candidatus Margulisbacteria bacterium GWF2_35_9]|nr:MAG: hypothetical protein A2Y40_05100 [Candidatus Margulisbacteria bacterium GWF2_35_9]